MNTAVDFAAKHKLLLWRKLDQPAGRRTHRKVRSRRDEQREQSSVFCCASKQPMKTTLGPSLRWGDGNIELTVKN
jgi:hypothetical protein